ncbi:MAG: poly-gamma-glutamate biosynthesis protein PgsC/CapC [Pseudomonadota bacterium]
MLNLFPLSIFPEGGLASSVVTCVWVGMAVVVFLNLRFGWVLSGLVVPGYLVPLILLKPLSAAVVLGESIITYGLVWFYSEFLSRRFGWSNFFGRDRFFALVLSSVLVRIICDGVLLPLFGEWLNNTYQLQFDYRNNLHSFGLIIVALIANTFWKSGLRKGLLPLVVTIGATLLIVRYGLMTLTNFNVSSLAYVYEPMADSMLASPKAYIVLLVTAFLASRLNLLYGWDFAGILLPSLLALEWYQPSKVLASFVEATIILLLARAALRLPVFHGVTMEGGRKLLLFFNVSYLYKFALAYFVIYFFPEQKVTDLYGFGYLLPTLIAVKMHEKEIYARMTVSMVQASLVAVACATVIGFGLSFLPNPMELIATKPQTVSTPLANSTRTLREVIGQEKITAYRTRLQGTMALPAGFELDHFRRGLEALAEYRHQRESRRLDEASTVLGNLGFRLELLEGRYLLLREREPYRHWGVFVIDLQTDSHLAVEVPAPLDERGTSEAGAQIFRTMHAQSLAIAGAARFANKDGSADVLANPQTPYEVFHQVFGGREALQIRGYTAESAGFTSGKKRDREQIEITEPASSLWVKRALPDDLDLVALKELIGDFDLRWGELPLRNVQRETLHSGFAELQLRRDDMRRLLNHSIDAKSPAPTQQASTQPSAQRTDFNITGSLPEWLLSDKARLAPPGSELYRKPALEELFFFDEEVLTPLLANVAKEYRKGAWTTVGSEEIGVIRGAASTLGYELLNYRHPSTGAEYLILAEPTNVLPAARRYWGTYVFRVGSTEPFEIQVPQPAFEVNSFELGISLFETLHARALLIGGGAPNVNLDHSANLLALNNKENLFNVVNQALLRATGSAPLLVMQARAVGQRPDLPLPAADVVLAAGKGIPTAEQMSPLTRRLVNVVERYGLTHTFAGDTPQTAGYEAGGLVSSLYLNATENKEFVILWVSPLASAGFREQSEPTPQQAQFQALRVSTVNEDLTSYVARHGNKLGVLPASLRIALTPYFLTQDIVVLHNALKKHSTLRFERVVDATSRQGFLAVLGSDGTLLGLINLAARASETIVPFASDAAHSSIDRFVEARAAWLLVKGVE